MSATPRWVEDLRAEVAAAQGLAAKHVTAVVKGEHPDAHLPWKEASTQTRAALILTQGTMAAQRTEQMSQAPKSLGVVVVHARLEDTPANRTSWEANVARLRDAVEVPALPAKEPDGT